MRKPTFATPEPLVWLARRSRHRISALLARSSRIGDRPIYPAGLFEWASRLEADWQAIRDELLALLDLRDAIPPLGEISPEHRELAPDSRWKSFFLTGYGYRIEENCRRCPRTAAAVERIPGLVSAFFSILEPGTHIHRHRGVTKAFLNGHLGLIVPADGTRCKMEVADQTVRWREGRLVVFDDTYPHEVWNDTDQLRAVLLIQFRRPVGTLGRVLAGAFLVGLRHSAFVQDVRAGLGRWESAMQRLERETPDSG